MSSVDLFQLHNQVTLERGGQRNSLGVDDVLGPVASAFDALRREGLCRWCGFTGLGEPAALRQVATSGAFHAMQAYFNLLNPSAILAVPRGFTALDLQQVAALAHERGLGVLNIRVLAAGALAGRALPAGGQPIAAGADAAAEEARAAVLRRALGLDAKQLHSLALRFALQRPEIDGVLVGFGSADARGRGDRGRLGAADRRSDAAGGRAAVRAAALRGLTYIFPRADDR